MLEHLSLDKRKNKCVKFSYNPSVLSIAKLLNLKSIKAIRKELYYFIAFKLKSILCTECVNAPHEI